MIFGDVTIIAASINTTKMVQDKDTCKYNASKDM